MCATAAAITLAVLAVRARNDARAQARVALSRQLAAQSDAFLRSGRLDLGSAEDGPAIDQTQLWEGNSVLRGQQPIVKR